MPIYEHDRVACTAVCSSVFSTVDSRFLFSHLPCRGFLDFCRRKVPCSGGGFRSFVDNITSQPWNYSGFGASRSGLMQHFRRKRRQDCLCGIRTPTGRGRRGEKPLYSVTRTVCTVCIAFEHLWRHGRQRLLFHKRIGESICHCTVLGVMLEQAIHTQLQALSTSFTTRYSNRCYSYRPPKTKL